MVEIRLGKGDNVQSLWAHKDLLRSKSEFFANALNGRSQEADENVVKLPDDDVEIFELYIQLLYTGKIPSITDIAATAGDPVYIISSEHCRLCNLYVLAEKLQDRTAKDTIIDAVVEAAAEDPRKARVPLAGGYLRYFPSKYAIVDVYQGTPSSSPMRKLLVDFYVEFGRLDWFTEEDCEMLPKAYFSEIARCISERRTTMNTRKSFDSRNYHEKRETDTLKLMASSTIGEEDQSGCLDYIDEPGRRVH